MDCLACRNETRDEPYCERCRDEIAALANPVHPIPLFEAAFILVLLAFGVIAIACS